jgi:hypothetical protein
MVELKKELSIIALNEYILNHGELAKQPNCGDNASSNLPAFIRDLSDNRLERYKGTFVLYWKGILCGQSEHPDLLYKQASDYYGKSHLACFFVPQHKSASHKLTLIDALGEY